MKCSPKFVQALSVLFFQAAQKGCY